ncbi:rab-interacting lysosomal protein isoform X5 [Heterocephalus glaber]|uniref:Rab-interacting lysosomal protein n=1 Tax=Heterocephalus glaber TaxID=10181 RepID=A0AAX6RB35_HETGA|nr:rab-interacting lysosomal protein isoform X5 [Heterocephalus glaber]
MDPRRAAPGALGWGPRVAAGSGTAAELVYHLAGALGAELQELASRFGPEATAGLVPLVVRALELLEKAAVGPAPDSLQVSAQQAEVELRRLREENEHLRREARAGPQEERALLRQLKEVTDRQRDELRAHGRDLQERSQEIEALQEQLQRLLLVNAELHRKLAAVQAQLRAAQERERERELPRDGAREPAEEQKQEPQRAPPKDLRAAHRPQGPWASARSHEDNCQEAAEEDQGQDVRNSRGSREQRLLLYSLGEKGWGSRACVSSHAVPERWMKTQMSQTSFGPWDLDTQPLRHLS